MNPIAKADGHDPWLLDEFVPGEAAMVDDVVVGFEDAVRKPVIPRVLPDIFGRVGRHGLLTAAGGSDGNKRVAGAVKPSAPNWRSVGRQGRPGAYGGPRSTERSVPQSLPPELSSAALAVPARAATGVVRP